MSQAIRPSFLDRLTGSDKPGTLERQAQRALRNQIEELQEREAGGEPKFLSIGSKAKEAAAVIKAERKLIGTIRQALKDYDRYVRPDGRRNNGKGPKRVDPKQVEAALRMLRNGRSIRRAADACHISFGTLYKAKVKAGL